MTCFLHLVLQVVSQRIILSQHFISKISIIVAISWVLSVNMANRRVSTWTGRLA